MNITLQDLSKGPVYAQVRQQIETLIGTKAVASGETLPAPATLAQKLAVTESMVQHSHQKN